MLKYKKIGIHYEGDTSTARGPSKVFNNLVKGLNQLGISYSVNTIEEFNCSLNNSGLHFPVNTLMGPNLVCVPSDNPSLYGKYTNFLVNSDWTFNIYKQFSLLNGKRLDIWSVGIDTDLYNDSNKNIKYDCFVYRKNRSDYDLQLIENQLNRLNLSYKVITYGQYHENELIDLTKSCKFCILLTHTESQGIAYMEILSANVPCLVINHPEWRGYAATSVPYFNKECGIISDINSFSVESFIQQLNNFTSRNYILNNHTLKIGSQKYINIINNL